MRRSQGWICVKLISAAPAETLAKLNLAGIVVHRLRYDDDFTVCFSIRRRNYKKTSSIAAQQGDRLVVLQEDAVTGVLKGVLKRPILLFGAALLVVLTLYVPSRIFFVTVEGNSSIPSRQIIAAAEEHGLMFGASRQKIRSEKIKNALLLDLPQLQWVGVNTKGCVARISVRERLQTEERTQTVGISSIIAGCDGVIREMTVTAGNPVCKVGQAVREGELLVSGYSDCGICIHGTTASAEILADTQRNLTVTTPMVTLKRSASSAVQKKYSLLVGKKRINFSKNSGIYSTTCGKMYAEYYLDLPGGFRLPMGIAVESIFTGDVTEVIADEKRSSSLLEDYARQYLSGQMIAGKILGSDITLEPGEGTLQLNGIYRCSEMIGKIRCEETIDRYGEGN